MSRQPLVPVVSKFPLVCDFVFTYEVWFTFYRMSLGLRINDHLVS